MQLKAVSDEPKKSKTSQSSKPTIAEVYRELSDVLNHDSFTGHPRMTETFFVVQPERGPPQVVEQTEPGVVQYVDRIRVVGCLLRYIENYLGGSKVFGLTFKMGVECINYWATKTPPIPMPKPFADKSDTSMTFHRLPFDLVDDGKATPNFDSILLRMDGESTAAGKIKQSDLVRYWFGSLFVPESDRSSYLWIFGEGGDGKGRLSKVLSRVLGPAYMGSSVPETGERRFWTHGLLGKRLVAFGECNNYSFPMSGLFKSITGGDSVTFEPKGLPSFSAVPDCKFLFLSNERPGITGSKANMRRALYVEMRKFTLVELKNLVPQAVLDGRLWDEAPSFFGKCVAMYLKKYPDHGPILCDDGALTQLVEENEEWMVDLTDKYLVADKDDSIASSRMQEIRQIEKLSTHDYRNWLSYLKRVHEITPANDGTQRRWKGIRHKTDVEYGAYILNKGGASADRSVTRAKK